MLLENRKKLISLNQDGVLTNPVSRTGYDRFRLHVVYHEKGTGHLINVKKRYVLSLHCLSRISRRVCGLGSIANNGFGRRARHMDARCCYTEYNGRYFKVCVCIKV